MAMSTPKLFAFVALVLAGVCGVAVGASEAFKHDTTQTATIARHIERVVVHADAGDVHLMGTDAPRVTVREQLQWLMSRPRVRMALRRGTLTVSGSCPNSGPVNRCKADLLLAIPFDAKVIVRSNSGDVIADRLAGHLELSTDTGDVVGRDLNPAVARATTNAGNVDLAFTIEPVTVAASSEAGDVLVTVPAGGEYRVDATTDAGDVTVEGLVRNDRSRRSISARANAGDVTVRGRAG
jgi:DUF4097 and DUF4098 domain-containing protein YvlB